MDYCGAIECALEGLHCETGPGVWEAALQASVGVEAADRANLFKTFSKVFLQKEGLLATFMAKWSMDYPGQSGHFHFSFEDDDHTNQFYEANAEATMSFLQRHAIGGLQRYLPEWISMVAPTVNSYTRLVKGAWAPTAATWGVENRTAGIRVIPGGARSQRIECRVGGADGNPYLVAAAVLAAAARGIEEKLEPTAAVSGNAYDIQDALPEELQFPSTLRGAAERMSRSAAAVESFGADFVDHFVMSRLWESREYERHVNSWQLERYFEVI
jgi:glutamine synthetase